MGPRPSEFNVSNVLTSELVPGWFMDSGNRMSEKSTPQTCLCKRAASSRRILYYYVYRYLQGILFVIFVRVSEEERSKA